MESVRERLVSNVWATAGIALVLGLILGLGWAWGIQPVEWVDGTPENLRNDLRQDYLRMAIDSYSVNRDVDLAIDRYQRLGEAAAGALTDVGADPREVNPTAIQNFSAVIEIFESESEGGAVSEPEAAGTTGIFAGPLGLVVPVCGATVVLGVLLFAALYLRRRLTTESDYVEEGVDYGDELPGVAVEEAAMAGTAPSIGEFATFRTIYTLGDDLYDDSFSIESPTGDFLGECGVGIGDVMGMGDPKKVSAFEVWLFDKNDIQTVTQVLMSAYAYGDEATRSRLAAKGDPVQAESGGVLTLETASLRVEARIVDMKYGEGALPENSFFERITVELRTMPIGDIGELA